MSNHFFCIKEFLDASFFQIQTNLIAVNSDPPPPSPVSFYVRMHGGRVLCVFKRNSLCASTFNWWGSSSHYIWYNKALVFCFDYIQPKSVWFIWLDIPYKDLPSGCYLFKMILCQKEIYSSAKFHESCFKTSNYCLNKHA